MKRIQLKSLVINNFKGIKELELNFDSKETNIHGANGTGKTTVSDSYTWLLYGKNSEDKKDFSIKPLDKNNNYIHNLESSVEGVLIVDGIEIKLQRIYKEKWTKKRGSENSELTGHEQVFYINEVPVNLSEFTNKVENILSDELQKILSNPLYFNTKLDWKKRRSILSEIVGEVSDEEVLNLISSDKKDILKTILLSDKTLEDYKKEYQSKRKKIKDELELIPSRIDEATKSLPETKNWDEIQSNIDSKTKEIEVIDSKIEDSTKAVQSEFDNINKIKQNLFAKQQELTTLNNTITTESKKELNQNIQKESDINHILQINKSSVKQIEEKVSQIADEIVETEKATQALRDKLTEENASLLVIDPNDCVCPTCSREYETEKVSTIKVDAEKKFNDAKAQKIAKIREQGGLNNAKVAKLKEEILSHENKKAELNKIISEKEVELVAVKKVIEELSKVEVKKTDGQIKLEAEIQSIIVPETKPIDNSELKLSKIGLQNEIDSLKAELHDKKQIETVTARIVELNESQKTMAQSIASIEQIELSMDEFNRIKIDSVESRVNSMFKLVKFKMFEEQLNGGTNENCKCTLGGVDFSDLNTASKINAGIDVLNVLSSFYKVNSTMFLDGKESVTNIIETDSQVINLIVDPAYRTLTIV